MKRNEKGLSILEQVMVYPILLTMILGAIDINNVLQAYSALQNGVHASLRCVYTTDGKCVSTQPDTRPRLYDYYRVDRSQQFLVDRFNFSGTSSWIDKPEYQLSNFRADVLNQVRFDGAAATFSAMKRFYGASRQASYYVTTARHPYVSGDPLNPTVHFRGTLPPQAAAATGSYPSAVISIGGISGSLTPTPTNANPATISLNSSAFLPLPTAPASAPFLAADSERPYNPQNSPPLSPNWNQRSHANRYQAAIHITGSKSGTDPFSQGAVGITLAEYTLNNVYRGSVSLGGRLITRAAANDINTQANFVIRGVPSAWRSASVNGSGYAELDNYNGELSLRYDRKYRIQFTLRHDFGGTVAWQGGEIRIYVPQHAPQSAAINCAQSFSYCDTPQSCQTGVPAAAQDIFGSNPVVVNTAGGPTSFGPTLQLGNCLPAPASMQALLASNGINECEQNFHFSASTTGCGIVPTIQNCPTNGNYGVPQLVNSSGEIYNSAQAMAICPPQTSAALGLPAPSNIRWTEHNISVPAAHIQPNSTPTFNWTKTDCNQNLQFPSGSQLASYPKLTYNTSLAGFVPEYTGSTDPALLKSSPSSGYACAEFPLRSVIVDVLPTQVNSGNQTSLFYGEHSMPGCSWEQTLQSDAIQHGLINANAFFKADAPLLGTSKDLLNLAPDVCVDPSPEIIWSEPTGRTLVPGGPYPDGVMPAICQQAGVACTPQFAGFGPGSPSQTSYDFKTAAQYFGFNELSTQYPRAKWACSGEDCVNMTITDDGTHFTSTAQMDVPVKLFFGKSTTLQYTQRERKEALLAQ